MENSQLLALNTIKALDLSSTNNTVVVPLNGTPRLLLSVNGLTGSGAEIRVNGSNDNGVSFPDTNSVGTNNVDFRSSLSTPAVINGDYLMITGMYTHLKISVYQAGNGTALLFPAPLSFREMAAYYPRDAGTSLAATRSGPAFIRTTSTQLVSVGTYAYALYLQSAPTNTGKVWLNSVGGPAVVGQGTSISPGGTVLYGVGGPAIPNAVISAISESGISVITILGS